MSVTPGADRPPTLARFDGFELDVPAGELHARGDSMVRLPEQSLCILLALLEHPGEVVTRDQIRKKLWPEDTIVEFEHSISAAVNRLRQALGDSADRPKYIETLPRRGYRWMVAVEWSEENPYLRASQGAGSEEPSRRDADPLHDAVETGSSSQKARAHRQSGSKHAPILAGAGALVVLLCVTALLWSSRSKTIEVPEFAQRQLTASTSENPVWAGAISPDGNYLAYSDGVGIHIKLMTTGELRHVRQPESLGSHHVDWRLSWYPDSARLIANAAVLGEPDSLWTVSVLGGQPRKIRDSASGGRVSPNGSWIAYTTNHDRSGNREIWLMGPDGTHARRLAGAEENSEFESLEWSSDSQRVAYARYRQGTTNSDAIESRDLQGHPPITVISGPFLAKVKDFTWLPDGRMIYLTFEPGVSRLSCNYWSQPVNVATGEPRGEPRQLTHWAGFCMDHTSATADGKRLVFKRWWVQRSVNVADLDPAPPHISSPTRLTHSDGNEIPVAWTADSQSVVFVSNREGPWGIYKQSLRQDAVEPIVLGLKTPAVPSVSPDGRWLLYARPVEGTGSPDTRELVRVPITGGQPEFVLSAPYAGHRCARSPALVCVLGQRTSDLKHITFTAIDPVRGLDHTFTRFDTDPNASYEWDLSPDGTRIAVGEIGTGHIHILSLTGQRLTETTAKGWSSLENFHWSAAGDGFFAASRTPETSVLLYLDLDGNANVVWEQKGTLGNESPGTSGVPSPDGRHLAMMGFTLSGNMWMMENF